MADYSVTAASLQASSGAERQTQYNAGATLAIGDSVYLGASNTWIQTDANAASTGNGVADLRGIVESAGNSGQRISVITKDPALVLGATLVKGAVVVLSANAGKFAPSSDLAAGWYRVVAGVAASTTVVNFNPNVLASGATD